MLFRMRPSTPLDGSQERAWKKNRGAVEATSEEDWLLLEWYFAQGGETEKFRRKDLGQLMNNWNGEISRAGEAAQRSGWTRNSQKKEGGRPEPAGDWRKVLVEIFDDTAPEDAASAVWDRLPASVRDQIIARMEGGVA
jgi:hypothetical protein